MQPSGTIHTIQGFLSSPFTLLDDSKSKLFLVAFCGLFATLFIVYFNPFNIKLIHYDAAIGRYLPIWSAGVIGALILGVTQFVLRPLFNLSTWSIGQFLLWLGIEFGCLTAGVFFLFAEYNEPLLQELMLILKYTVSLALLPYMMACLIISVFQMSARLNRAEEKPVFESSNHVFKDDQGKVTLVVQPEHILCLKSENNYASVFYRQNGKVERKLLRTTLKKLDATLNYPYLLRIHRSHMINLHQIASVIREKGDYHVQLEDLPDMKLRVSESYKTAFESKVDHSANMTT